MKIFNIDEENHSAYYIFRFFSHKLFNDNSTAFKDYYSFRQNCYK